MSDLTSMLNRFPQLDDRESGELLAELYADLRRMAASRMAGEAPGHTLQATALVNEALLRVARPEGGWDHRGHFFAAVSEAMRRILIESARRRLAGKRGGGAEHVPLEDSVCGGGLPDEKLLQVHEALRILETEDRLRAEIVKLHIFAGLSHGESGALLGLSERSVRRHWKCAKLRLYEIIAPRSPAPGGGEGF